MSTTAKAYAVRSPKDSFAPFSFERRDLLPRDVSIEILYCGICHTDLHIARDDWGGTHYPCVPGHEIVGRVTAVGAEVTKFRPGDLAGVGCMVDSCGRCMPCQEGEEQYCTTPGGMIVTYDGPDRVSGGHTFGGYSDHIVVDEGFVLRVGHDEKDLAAVAPLLCAGITLYSPLKRWQAGPGKRVGIVGLGGLGHMGVKIAAAMGAHVTVFTTSPGKRDDAIRLGARDVIVSNDRAAMKAAGDSFDMIVDTVAVPHDLDGYLSLLKYDGSLILVGVPAEPHPSPSVSKLVLRRRSISGSLIGGIAETQEMLDFCRDHAIVSDIELISAQEVNGALERMVRSDVKYRFVIDSKTIAHG